MIRCASISVPISRIVTPSAPSSTDGSAPVPTVSSPLPSVPPRSRERLRSRLLMVVATVA